MSWARRAPGRLLVALAFVASMGNVGPANWAHPELVPVARLTPQLEARVAASPSDAHAHYLLGRVHSAAFANGCDGVLSFGYRDGPSAESAALVKRLEIKMRMRTFDHVATTAHQRDVLEHARKDLDTDPAPPSLEARRTLEHLERAVTHLSRAVELAPGTDLYELGLAFVLDAGAHLSNQVDVVPARAVASPPNADQRKEIDACLQALVDPAATVRDAAEHRLAGLLDFALPVLVARRADSDALRQAAVARLIGRQWRELAIRGYLRAHTLALDDDRRSGVYSYVEREVWFSGLVSVEAGRSYSRLVTERGARDDEERKRVEEIGQALIALEKSEDFKFILTPILVPDADDAALDALFDGASACFDLAGIGVEQRWPWPRADVSFLVWDPECTGTVSSGRQLFGSATWWMFFEDGYSALDALDVDGDGWLAGAELEGLALWRDANRDGVSDAGEVDSLAHRGVHAIATRADGIDGISPMRSEGVVLTNGSTLPTFDWIASPVPGT